MKLQIKWEITVKAKSVRKFLLCSMNALRIAILVKITARHSSDFGAFHIFLSDIFWGLPTSIHSLPFGDGLKVSETCLRHILSFYLIYNLTASKYLSYLNHQGQNSLIVCKKTFVTPEARHLTTRIPLSYDVDNLKGAAIFHLNPKSSRFIHNHCLSHRF